MSKYLHIITGLKTGGAEAMLFRLLEKDPELHTVLSLTSGGKYYKLLCNCGVNVVEVGSSNKLLLVFSLRRIIRIINTLKPKVIIGWMYHGNLVATFVSMVTKVPHIWNIRHSVSSIKYESRMLQAVIKISALFSRYPCKILYNSHASAIQHKALRYYSNKSFVVPNGIDTSICKRREQVVNNFLVKNNLEGYFIIGHFARYHPIKDHKCFIESISILKNKIPNLKVVMAGTNIDSENNALMSIIVKYNLESTVLLLGEQSDVINIMNSLDLFVLSSAWGEGFPNVLLEAMCCGIPVVSTNVGDAAVVVSGAGKIIEISDNVALSEEILNFYNMNVEQREEIGKLGVKRVCELYDIIKVRSEYIKLWNKCL